MLVFTLRRLQPKKIHKYYEIKIYYNGKIMSYTYHCFHEVDHLRWRRDIEEITQTGIQELQWLLIDVFSTRQ